MGITQIDFEYRNKVETATKLIQAYEPPEGYYLAFSGGKDSVVIYDLALKSGVRFDAHYNVSPIDPPEIHQFIKQHCPGVQWDYHARGFWKKVVKKGLPMRQRRWCCEFIKEAGGDGRIVILGIRADESSGRKGRKCFEQSRNKKKHFLSPILSWNSGEVWEYIKANNLPSCSLYGQGFKRLGCVLCPFSREIETAYFPKIVKCWRRSCDRLVARFKAQNYMTKRGKPMKHKWATGQELYDWWIKRD